MKKLGVIVNPVAGMGGRVGLKGSDGIDILRQARKLGAQPESPHRAVDALKVVAQIKDRIEVITCPGEMGEAECRRAGISATVLDSPGSGQTTPEDTHNAAREMAAQGIDLLLFAGGDGTARNVYGAIGDQVPVLGIPAGVKIHSAVYAVSPKYAGEVAVMFLEGKLSVLSEAEGMDIDEDAFRQGVVAARLYGYLRVPQESRYVQSVKAGGARSEKQSLQGIADEVLRLMDEQHGCYIIGPGTTTRAIMQALGLNNTLLGVDTVHNKRLVASDMSEHDLIDIVSRQRATIVVTIIGGQGHVFGRGNQQLSPRVIRAVGKENILVIATKEKLTLLSGRPLLVDTGDEDLNQELSGYMRVTVGYQEYVMYKVGY